MAWYILYTLEGKAEKKNTISTRLTPSKSGGSPPTGDLVSIETCAVKFVVMSSALMNRSWTWASSGPEMSFQQSRQVVAETNLEDFVLTHPD